MSPAAHAFKTIKYRLRLRTMGANVAGGVLTFLYFNYIDPLPAQSMPDPLPGAMRLVIFVVMMILILQITAIWADHAFGSTYAWYERLRTATVPTAVPADVQRQALNLAPYLALMSFLVWVMAGLFFSLIYSFGRLEQGLRMFTGTVSVGGVLTTALVYFVVDLAWRQTMPVFFPQGNLSSVRAWRLPVLGRLVIVFALIGAWPPTLLAYLSWQRASALTAIVGLPGPEAAAQAEAILSNLFRLELFVVGACALVSIGMAVFVTRSVVGPLRTLQAAMTRVEQHDLAVQVPVTTNDELGYVSERFNAMVGSLDRRNRELQAVYQISREIAANLELDQTLQTVLARVRQMIAYDSAEVYLYDTPSGQLQRQAWATPAQVTMSNEGPAYRLGEGYAGWIGEHRQSLLVPDVSAHREQHPVTRQLSDGVTWNSYLGVPLIVGDKLIGTLELTSIRPGGFDDHARQLLETIAPQTAIAIQNALQVIERERILKAQINALRIEIDEVKRAQQVAEVTETDYFRGLQQQAQQIRKGARP